MWDRIKELEEKFEKLEKNQKGEKNMSESNFTNRVREYIKNKKIEAKEQGKQELILLCNDIQKVFNVKDRAPSVCTAMYDSMQPNDEILHAPPKKQSTTVKIKYYV